MTAKDYRGRSRLLQDELGRISRILEENVKRKDFGSRTEDGVLIRKVSTDLAYALKRSAELDREYWGEEK